MMDQIGSPLHRHHHDSGIDGSAVHAQLAEPQHAAHHADLHLAPMIGAFLHTPEAASVLQHHPNVQRWWGGMENRASMAATAPQLG